MFFALAAYVGFESVRALLTGAESDSSRVHRHCCGVAAGDAVPVLGAAPYRPGARLQRCRRRLHPLGVSHFPGDGGLRGNAQPMCGR